MSMTRRSFALAAVGGDSNRGLVKDGGYLAILMRVAQGEIIPPEQRNPERARSGIITRELSAIAIM